MLKVTPERRSADTRRPAPTPAAARTTSERALLSAYSPKSGAVGSADGKGSLPDVSVKAAAAAKDPLPRVWNFNKPKILKNFSVYGKQAALPVGGAKTTVRKWVNPSYPVDRKKNRSGGGPRNYDALYVPLDDDDGRCSDGSKADKSHSVEAKRRQVYINHWTQLEANQEQVLKENQTSFEKFPCLRPAGERHSLKVQKNIGEMAKLIGEVREIRQQLGIADEEPLLPPPPQFAGDDFQPSPLVRSRTWTYFSISEYPHPKLYEYIKCLPHASTPNPITPNPTQQDASGTLAEN